MAQMWKVIGGVQAGGILARTGFGLKSLEASPSRVSTGAIIQELELQGRRLKFRLIEGTGPQEGWVSLKLKEKPLVEMSDYKLPECAGSGEMIPCCLMFPGQGSQYVGMLREMKDFPAHLQMEVNNEEMPVMVASLCSMGFDEAIEENALHQAEGNRNAAVDILFSGQVTEEVVFGRATEDVSTKDATNNSACKANETALEATPENDLDPSMVVSLCSMGFDEADVKRAIHQTAGNQNAAVDFLLSGQVTEEVVFGSGPSMVASLCSMGFDEADVKRAIHQAEGNQNTAVELLLSGQVTEELVRSSDPSMAASLCSMGFDEAVVENAARQAGGDQSVAVDLLFSGQVTDFFLFGSGPSMVASLCSLGFDEVAVKNAIRQAEGDQDVALDFLLFEQGRAGSRGATGNSWQFLPWHICVEINSYLAPYMSPEFVQRLPEGGLVTYPMMGSSRGIAYLSRFRRDFLVDDRFPKRPCVSS